MTWLKKSFWSLLALTLSTGANAQIIPNRLSCEDPELTRTLERLRRHELRVKNRQTRMLSKARMIDPSPEWHQHLQLLEQNLIKSETVAFRPAAQSPRVRAVIVSNRESVALQQMKSHTAQLKWALMRQIRENVRYRRDLQVGEMPLNLQVLETFTSYQNEREEVRQVAKRIQNGCLQAVVLRASLERKTASVPSPTTLPGASGN